MNQATARTNRELDDLASPRTIGAALGGVALGATLALVVLPYVTPALSVSLASAQPRTWWYLSRTSGLVAYALLALSMMLGLLLSTRFAKGWPGNATAFSLHEHASVLGLSLALFHAIVLLGDHHTAFTVAELMLPFGAAYRPFALGLGQLAFYGTVLLVGSFYVRKRIGQHAWRILHFGSFIVFVAALSHGLLAGTDHGLMLLGIAPVAAIAFFGFYRALSHVVAQRKPLSCSVPPCAPSLRSTGA